MKIIDIIVTTALVLYYGIKLSPRLTEGDLDYLARLKEEDEATL